ncbi:hypothetical protein F444_08833 [Phytophthora nicotianae P1976]|uniref:Uncharacterized protein n=1 Tax=Phytophthora nicotianae P1976 TaxID=1317066 RepID=A0A081A9Q3_PHYNI|nr:hypothetical protein F444_08833 [Phytophthora nicotianae P1976]
MSEFVLGNPCFPKLIDLSILVLIHPSSDKLSLTQQKKSLLHTWDSHWFIADSFALELVFEWGLEYLNFSLALSIEHLYKPIAPRSIDLAKDYLVSTDHDESSCWVACDQEGIHAGA